MSNKGLVKPSTYEVYVHTIRAFQDNYISRRVEWEYDGRICVRCSRGCLRNDRWADEDIRVSLTWSRWTGMKEWTKVYTLGRRKTSGQV